MLKNVTITLTEESALWARRQAAERNTSVSKFVGRLIEEQMRHSDEYWKALDEWKAMEPMKGADASGRFSRDEVHER